MYCIFNKIEIEYFIKVFDNYMYKFINLRLWCIKLLNFNFYFMVLI